MHIFSKRKPLVTERAKEKYHMVVLTLSISGVSTRIRRRRRRGRIERGKEKDHTLKILTRSIVLSED
jgi:hypothetical protein